MKVIGFVGDVVEGFAGVIWTGFKYMVIGSLIGAVILTTVIGAIIHTM